MALIRAILILILFCIAVDAAVFPTWFTQLGNDVAPTNGWMMGWTNPNPVWTLNGGALTNINLSGATNNGTVVSNGLFAVIQSATNQALISATNQSLLIGANATNDDLLFGLNSTNNSVTLSNNLQTAITNEALFIGAAATNEALLIGLNGTNNSVTLSNNLETAITNEGLFIGAGATNEALLIGSNGTNESTRISNNATNEALLIGSGATNEALLIGSSATNNDTLLSQNATNESLLIGASATNESTRISNNATNEALLIGSNGTNNASLYEVHVSTLTNQLYATNVVSGGTILGTVFPGILPLVKTWTQTAAPGSATFRSVVYGGSLYATVGTIAIATSSDGVNWFTQTSPANQTWFSVTYGAGTYVAVGFVGGGGASTNTMSSTDGTNWTVHAASVFNAWVAIAFGNSKFVSVANGGTTSDAMTSSDGATWATSTTPASTSGWQALVFGNGLFVAGSADNVAQNIMTSPDGVTWVKQTGSASIKVQSLAYGNGVFVASLNGSPWLMVSPDGTNWTTQTPSVSQATRVTFGHGLFVAAGSGSTSTSMWSHDGTNWNSLATPAATAWNGIGYGGNINGAFIAVRATSQTMALPVTDLTNWNATASTVAVYDSVRNLASAIASGAVPIDANGTATTFAQLNGLGSTLTTNNATLTSGRVQVGDGGRGVQNATASGSVPIDADGSATTFAQVNALAGGSIVTNGESLAITVSNTWTIDATHFMSGPVSATTLTNSGGTANTLAISDANNKLVGLANGSSTTVLVGGAPPSFTTVPDGAMAAPSATAVSANTGGWSEFKVAGSDFTRTAQSLADVTGLVTGTLSTSSLYDIDAFLYTTSSSSAGNQYGVNCTGTGSPACGIVFLGATTTTAATNASINALTTAETPSFCTGSQTSFVRVMGWVLTGTGSPAISIQALKTTSGTCTVKIGSVLRIRKM